MPTTGWSSCGVRRARCSRVSWTSAGAAPSSRGPSGTSSSAPAWPAWSSSTSGIRPSTSGASTGCPSPTRTARTPARHSASRSTSAAWPSRAPTTSRLVVDWRAPVAEPFYRATGLDPQGLARRRHLAVRGRTVLGLEDEYFVDPDGRAPTTTAPGADGSPTGNAGGERLLSDGIVLGGPGALLSALGQARTGHMGDIIGTIQREQDEIIRSPLAGVLVVQGGPGTGKTAVALHRAAYLLYTHRFPLERQGVLVVGPNPLFLRYIEQVLPSLGETGVSLSTVAGLVPEVRVRGVDAAAVAKLKGDVRMVKVLARAVRTRQRPAPPRRRDPLRRGGAAPPRPDDRGHRGRGAAAARHPQRAAPLRRGAGAARPLRRVPVPAEPRRDRHGERRRRPRRSRPTWRSGCAACPRWPKRSIGCGPACRRTSSSTTSSAPGPCWRRRARGSSARRRCSGCTGPAAPRSTRCTGRWRTPH